MPVNTQVKPFELDKNRIEGLNHGIFAIVMTLLVFELKTSDLPQHASNIQLAPALFEMWPKFHSPYRLCAPPPLIYAHRKAFSENRIRKNIALILPEIHSANRRSKRARFPYR